MLQVNKRYSAVLSPLASLPGPFAVGTMGQETVDFIRKLSENKFSFWQLLPLNIVDKTNSPYKSCSSFAGDSVYIDPRLLIVDGLLTENDLKNQDNLSNFQDSAKANFIKAKINIYNLLKKAYLDISPLLQKCIDEFVEQEKYWLKDYALFMTAKALNNDLPWWEWENQDLIRHEKNALEDLNKNYAHLINFYYFEQWVFQRQWQYIKTKAKEYEVALIGDLPFYVDADSVDVWANNSLFVINDDLSFPQVAGVPPDYFCADGQLWGNPLYLWAEHKKEKYLWWQKRIERMLNLFDVLRLDHFRAFANYWAVTMPAVNAKEGSWQKGPGQDFFTDLLKKYPSKRFIAEDLGVYDEEVSNLLIRNSLPNMNVLQFTLNSAENFNMPYNAGYNSVVYTGTHDNNTILAWIWDMSDDERAFVLNTVNFSKKDDWGKGDYDSPICKAIIHKAWSMSPKIAVTTLQDLCGFGADTRINIPGNIENNWVFRFKSEIFNLIKWNDFKILNIIFKRDNSFYED